MNFIIKNKPTFYFFFASPPKTGGDLVVLSHINTLVNAGINVEIFYNEQRGENGKSIVGFPNLKIHPITEYNQITKFLEPDNHYMVIGESQSLVHEIAVSEGFDKKTIIFNQAYFWTAYAFPYHDSFKDYKMAAMIAPSYTVFDRMEEIYDWKRNSTVTAVIHPIIQQSPNLKVNEYKNKNNKVCKVGYITRNGKRKSNTNLIPFLFLNLYPEYKNKVEFIEIKEMKHNEVLDTIAGLDIFFNSGFNETLGLSALESMYAYVHVIGFSGHVNDNEYFNENTGWWIHNNDETSINSNINLLKEAIDLYYSDEESQKEKRRKLLEHSYDLVVRDFSYNTNKTDILLVYNNIYTQIKERENRSK